MPEAKEKEREADKTADGKITAGENNRSREVAAFFKEQSEQVTQSNKPWMAESKNIVQRFRDERSKGSSDAMRRFNAIWANYKILLPAIFSDTPIPIIERKFLDRDPVARLSAQILERAERNEVETNGLYNSLRRAVSDYLLPGRGVVWVRYEPEIGEGDSIPATYQDSMEDSFGDAFFEATTEENPKPIPRSDDDEGDKLSDTGEQVLAEAAPVDYIDYRDFKVYPSNVRNWPEVQAVSKKILVSKREAIDRFGSKIGKAMKPDKGYHDSSNSGPVSDSQQIFNDINNRNIVVEELWNKIDRRVYWFSPGYEYLCGVKDDFLKLKDFFPVPEPISATLTNDSFIPVPDYIEYQDQALQLDELTQRLAYLTKACKVAGVYAAESDAVKRLLDEAFENQLIAVEDWAGLTEKGGLEGMIYFLPIEKIQEVIRTLTEVRGQVMQDMDLITGISDVIRGTTDSRETLGGIRLKNNNAGTRLSDRQKEVARFAKDTVAIVAEIMAKHFQDDTLVEKSGVMYLDEMQVETVIAELKAGKTKSQLMKPQKEKPITPGMGVQPPGAPPQGGPPQPGMPPQQPPMMGQGLPPPSPAQPPGPPQQPPGMMGQGLMPGQPPQQPPIDPAILERIEELEMRDEAQTIIDEKLEKALKLLRENITFYYRIDIETDSTVFGDAEQDKANATEFLNAVTTFMEKASVITQTLPQSMPLMGRMLQWGVRKFRTGRDLESSIDTFIQDMEGMVKDMADNPKPNPEEMKAQADLQIKQQEMEHQKQLQQMEQQAQQANDQRDVMKQQMEDQRQQELNQMEMAMEQQKAQLEREKMELEKQLMLMKHQLEVKKMEMESHHQAQTMQMEQQHNQQTMQLKTQEAQTTHGIQMDAARQQQEMQNTKHQQGIEAQKQKHTLGMEANEQKHKMAKEQATMKAKQPKKKAA